jgi:hypothetical protein
VSGAGGGSVGMGVMVGVGLGPAGLIETGVPSPM